MPSDRGLDAQRCLKYRCRTCHMGPGQDCISRSGRSMLYAFHRARKVDAGLQEAA